MISFQNVTKEFQLDERTTITPVKNVSLEIKKGELIIIIGRSGSGKTTFLNLAAGLVKPTSGKVLLDNLNLGEMNDKQLSKMRSQRLGFVFQFPSLLPALTVQENVALPAIFEFLPKFSSGCFILDNKRCIVVIATFSYFVPDNLKTIAAP